MAIRRLGATVVVLLAAGPVRVARADWVVDDAGQCVERWSASSLLRGPTAMLSAPTAPFRTAAGVYAYQPPQGGSSAWNPVVAFMSGLAGFVDTGVWLGTGLADTVTGGYFAIAPDRATRLGVDPLIPPFVSSGTREAIEAKRPDACGRTRTS